MAATPPNLIRKRKMINRQTRRERNLMPRNCIPPYYQPTTTTMTMMCATLYRPNWEREREKEFNLFPFYTGHILFRPEKRIKFVFFIVYIHGIMVAPCWLSRVVCLQPVLWQWWHGTNRYTTHTYSRVCCVCMCVCPRGMKSLEEIPANFCSPRTRARPSVECQTSSLSLSGPV